MSRIAFAGTPVFARESLRSLVESGNPPVVVLTQPDRPAGRGKKMSASAVKMYAEEQSLQVMQPDSLRDDAFIDAFREFKIDVLVVVAYGLLLPQTVLDIPRAGCVNVHASLLPRWRGAAPIQAAILAGDRETGISLMHMEAGLDSGPVYAETEVEIGIDDNAGDLHDRLARLGGDLLVQHLSAILAGEARAMVQDESRVTYAPKIATSDARLDWSQSAAILHRLVRAYNPIPGAWTMLGSERLKCWQAEIVDCKADDSATLGTIISAGKSGIDIVCAEQCLRVTELQRPGKTRISAADLTATANLVGLVLD